MIATLTTLTRPLDAEDDAVDAVAEENAVRIGRAIALIAGDRARRGVAHQRYAMGKVACPRCGVYELKYTYFRPRFGKDAETTGTCQKPGGCLRWGRN